MVRGFAPFSAVGFILALPAPARALGFWLWAHVFGAFPVNPQTMGKG